MIRYSSANAKTKELYFIPELSQWFKDNTFKVYSFDLLSGHSCPFAKECHAKVVNGKVVDGKHTKFRCFSASQEALFKHVYAIRNNNYESIKKLTTAKIFKLLSDNLPANAGVVRIHVSGDFYSQVYFDAWLRMAKMYPNVLFYAYTKSLKYWLNRMDSIPHNFVLTASYGGRLDNLISQENLRHAVVVGFATKQEAIDAGFPNMMTAEDYGYPVDHDDSHAAVPKWKDNSFALLVHGIQPAGSDYGKVWKINSGTYKRG